MSNQELESLLGEFQQAYAKHVHAKLLAVALTDDSCHVGNVVKEILPAVVRIQDRVGQFADDDKVYVFFTVTDGSHECFESFRSLSGRAGAMLFSGLIGGLQFTGGGNAQVAWLANLLVQLKDSSFVEVLDTHVVIRNLFGASIACLGNLIKVSHDSGGKNGPSEPNRSKPRKKSKRKGKGPGGRNPISKTDGEKRREFAKGWEDAKRDGRKKFAEYCTDEGFTKKEGKAIKQWVRDNPTK